MVFLAVKRMVELFFKNNENMKKVRFADFGLFDTFERNISSFLVLIN